MVRRSTWGSARPERHSTFCIFFCRCEPVCLTWQVAEEIWVVADNTVSKWNGTIAEYKEHLKSTHAALADRNKNTEMTER